MLNTLRTAIDEPNPWVQHRPAPDFRGLDLLQFAHDGMRSAMDIRN